MERKSMIIIGGGVAGLSTGIYAQLNNFKSTILEMHSVPGGQCTAWDRAGYRFDYCLQWLVGTRRSTFNKLWQETGVLNENSRIVDADVFAVYKDEKFGDFIMYTNIDKWQEYLTAMAPEDARSIRKMCKEMKRGIAMEPFENAPEMRPLMEWVRVIVKMSGLLFYLRKYGRMSTSEYLDNLNLKNEKLSFFLRRIYTTSDFSALVLLLQMSWLHAKNAGYVIGGSLPIAQRMAERYETLGGELKLESRVKKIIVENDRARGVELTDGSVLTADIVVSAADGHATLFDMLEKQYLTAEFQKAYATRKLFTPFVQVSFGVHDNIHSDAGIVTYTQNDVKIGRFVAHSGFMIMNQSSYDPTLAPEGRSSMVLRFDSPWEDWERVPAEKYADEKERIKQDSMALLEQSYPGIREKIDVVDVSTPLTEARMTGVWKGSFEGFLPSGDFLKAGLPNTLPNLKGFYMAGQWLSLGGGLPPSVQSGKWVVQKICKEEHVAFHAS